MIVKPKIRGFMCTTAHPEGCKAHVEEQIAYVKDQGTVQQGHKKVLVIGASTGYAVPLSNYCGVWFKCINHLGYFLKSNFRH